MNKLGKVILGACGVVVGAIVGICIYEEAKLFKEYYKHLDKMEDEEDEDEDIFVDEDDLFENENKSSKVQVEEVLDEVVDEVVDELFES